MNNHQYDPITQLLRGSWIRQSLLFVPPAGREHTERDSMKSYVTYSELFGRRPTLEELARRVGSIALRTIMLNLATIGIILENEGTGYPEVQRSLADQLLPASIRRRISRLQNVQDRILFFRQQLLIVMKIAILNSADRYEERSPPEWMEELVECLFMASDLMSENTIEAIDGSADIEVVERPLLQVTVRSFLTHSSEDLGLMLPRYSILFLDLPKRSDLLASDNTIDLEETFFNATGFDLRVFLALGFGILAQFMGQNLERGVDPSRTHVSRSSYFSQAAIDENLGQRMIDGVSVGLNEVRLAIEAQGRDPSRFFFDFLPMMRNPLYRIDEDVLVPFDFRFLKEKVTGGIYWTIFDFLEGEEKLRFTRFFGEVFEQYVRELFKRIFPEAPGLAKRLYHEFVYDRPRGERKTSDEIILYGEDVIFVEVTSSRIKMEETAIEGNLDSFERDLDKIIIKKARQLTRSIRDFRNGYFTLDEITGQAVRTIHPVLVTIQPFPQNTLIWRRIERTLADRQLLQEQGVERLHLIDVEELEMLEPALQSGLSLLQLLKEKVSNNGYRNITFKNFLHGRHPDVLRIQNEYLRSQADKFFEGVVQLLFPGAGRPNQENPAR